MKFVGTLLSIVLLLISNLAAIAEDVTLVSKGLNETLHESATISGVIVVGLIGGEEPIIDQLTLSAAMPPYWAGSQICVFVISADGLYESRNTYSIPSDWLGGIATIHYPTIHLDKLIRIERGNVTVMTRLGACEEGNVTNVVPAYWNTQPAEIPQHFTMMINSFRADEVFLYVGSAYDAPVVACEKLISGVRTAFDVICEFDVLDKESSETEIEINRVHGGVMAPPEFLTLHSGLSH